MKLEIETKELKQAVSATSALVKKMPSELSTGDAKFALLRDTKGFSIVTAFDYFTSSIPLPSVQIVGTGEEDITVWNEQGNVSENNAIGIVNDGELVSLLSKLTGVKKVTLDIDRSKQVMSISDEAGKHYRFDIRPPKKVMASFFRSISGEQAFAFSQDDLTWFCSTVSTLGSMIKPSASKPGYGCVCMSALPSAAQALQVSGNSDSDGYSMIYDTPIASKFDFTALIPKITAEGLNAYLTQMGGAAGAVDVHVGVGNDGKASSIAFSGDAFMLSLSCMTDDFPFKALGRIIQMVASPQYEEVFAQDVLKKTVDRLGVFAKGENAVTVVELLDGGMAVLSQKADAISRMIDAKEDCPATSLVTFPQDSTKGSTTVLTGVLKKTLTLFPAKSDIKVGITESGQGNGKLALRGDDGTASITAVLLGMRI